MTRPSPLNGPEGTSTRSMASGRWPLRRFLYHTAIGSQPGGFLGVSTFFTLSGFLITSLLMRERDRTDTIALPNFWSRRIRRLAPASFLNVALVLAITVAVPSAWPRTGMGWDTVSVFGNVFNWRIIAEGGTAVTRFLSPYSPLWSLAVEEQFYVVFPVVVLAVGAVAAGRSRRALAWVCGAGVVASILASLLITPSAAFGPSAPLMEQFRTDVRMGEILVGSLWRWRSPPGGWSTSGSPTCWVGRVWRPRW